MPSAIKRSPSSKSFTKRRGNGITLSMPSKRNRSATIILRPRFRILWNEEVALGPGKVELLRTIEQTGSIRESAQKLGMSYMRAWTLIRTMNACFKEPMVQTIRGGTKHGGAVLTDHGKETLRLFQKMETKSLNAVRAEWGKLKSLLGD